MGVVRHCDIRYTRNAFRTVGALRSTAQKIAAATGKIDSGSCLEESLRRRVSVRSALASREGEGHVDTGSHGEALATKH